MKTNEKVQLFSDFFHCKHIVIYKMHISATLVRILEYNFKVLLQVCVVYTVYMTRII